MAVRLTSALVVGLTAVLVAGCGVSAEEQARREVLRRAERIAHVTEAMASSGVPDGTGELDWPSNDSVVRHIVAETGGGSPAMNGGPLRQSVLNADRRGVGTLAVVEVAMIGQGESGFGQRDTESFVFCVRFEVRREQTGRRSVTFREISCPAGIRPSAKT